MKQNLNCFAILLLMLLLGVLPVAAQQNTVSGRVVDGETKEALEKTTLQLYRIGRRDTTFVTGTFTDGRGNFTLSGVSNGSYLLKFSFLGYKTLSRTVTKGRQVVNLGTVSLEPDAVQLNEAVVTANVPKMVIKDDTVVYNADAFRVPEGSVIEALVEMLPGAKIDDDGKISIRITGNNAL